MNYERQPLSFRKNSCAVVMNALHKTTSLGAFSSKMCRFGEILIDSLLHQIFIDRNNIYWIYTQMRRCNERWIGYSVLCFQSNSQFCSLSLHSSPLQHLLINVTAAILHKHFEIKAKMLTSSINSPNWVQQHAASDIIVIVLLRMRVSSKPQTVHTGIWYRPHFKR